nr:site-specific integrase [Thermoleophilaceae bacterium]
MLATAVFTGLRLGELLGLTWADVDLDRNVLSVRKQLSRSGVRVAPKTDQAERDVVLMPALASLLREYRLRSPFSAASSLVFAADDGSGIEHTAPRRALTRAMDRAGLVDDSRPKLRFHDLRHTFASLLISQGQNVVFVSRQLGHAKPDVTLGVYAHLFDGAEHAARASDALEARFGSLLGGKAVETSARNGPQVEGAEDAPNVAQLR